LKILLCPDKFKGSITAIDVCKAIATGLMEANPSFDITMLPLADGGDGSLDVLSKVKDLKTHEVLCTDPLGRSIKATYLFNQDHAFIELASASGLSILQGDERNPMQTSSLGTGLLIRDAIEKGFKNINLFVGGSATIDGGMGVAQALGFHFVDSQAQILKPIGSSLANVHSIKNHRQFDFTTLNIRVLCDVKNPLFGSQGAAHVYGAQKGASEADRYALDEGLKNLAKRIEEFSGQDVSRIEGIGAAGGVGASLMGLCDAKLVNGFDMFSQWLFLEEEIEAADFIISGEGKIDASTFDGKVVGNVIQLCEQIEKPIALVIGELQEMSVASAKIKFVESILSRAEDLNDAISNPHRYLVEIGKEIGLKIKKPI